MRHRPTSFLLNQLRNEVPGGVALADEVAKSPKIVRVEPTQLAFMKKFELIEDHGNLLTLAGTSVIVELAQ